MHTEGIDWRIRAHRRYRLEDSAHRRYRLEDSAHRRYRLEDTCTQKGQSGGYVHTEDTDWKMVMKEAKVLQGLYSHKVVLVAAVVVI